MTSTAAIAVSRFQQETLDRLSREMRGSVYETQIEVPIGSGRSLLSLRVPLVVEGCRTAVRFIPPVLMRTYEATYRRAIDDGFELTTVFIDRFSHIVDGTPTLHVLPVTRLNLPWRYQTVRGYTAQPDSHGEVVTLESCNPDTVIVDYHDFRTIGVVAGLRLRHYCTQREPRPRLVVWT